ncbi:UvrD-helicase domain-containing protein [Variovorax sp. NFACC27]|uniref:UvrD-helicase domain-containing protein n=1 Tax=unclassified Variovorax TaxID=663243 RepID=UPI000898F6BF|nr:UvrD-helicase domain-containing protein [Variovorax sp. YR750]SEF33449.1 DNA helicase-2 / ATP-dependent DNA helicase PcrA [Variovorax sp. NFACC28]SEG96404.1 DNA helicase-2 / ATP-dependent DNA helicase PcrA [Variovorax sp. NFACC29]SFD84284.1 DNA helicase-2 / ATP-dependent DNA helicase PcrA [Variovorax sp. NFACC26]SFG95952.1 DNA helicase-2 / ATP-dependent DNA helicase PcrA [Variovorax sp. NFACC27]SEL17910.1 DNA helicase-2 / ATP-dependent DNA helicase PcrA [Variovorax sp. YR750]
MLFNDPAADDAHSPALPLLQNLNAEQLAAVTLPEGNALILAGAGSGKTRVLTTRIAWLLQTGQVSAGGILAVTFTNKAAKEMMTRLTAMLPVNVRGMWIGTFHGLCNRLLRAHWKLANLPSTFQILDTQDQLSAIKRLMKQFNVDDERFPAKQTQWFIAGAKEDGLRPDAIEVRSDDDRKKVELYRLYEEQCQREGVVDFGELMLRSYELLRDNEPVREHYQRRFRHILIDEFQDTNRLQYAWIKMLAGNTVEGRFVPGQHNSVIAVGDDDQSIYAFRGARVGNMTDFVREFDVRHQIKLEQNYRSYSNILDSANELIGHNKKRLGKNLRTDQGPGEPVRVYESPTDLAEAQWMVEEMRQLVRDGYERKEMAVLYRSNAQSRVIETALFNASVPYRVYGGLRFFERAEIKHALAYLRLLENKDDDTSFLRVVNFPPRGIGARTLETLQDAARAANRSLHDAVSVVGGKAGANLTGFVAKIDVLREQTQGVSLREIIELVLDHSGLVEHYKADREGADRIENLDELVNAAESFVTQEGFGRDAVALPVDELRQSPASQGIDPSRPVLDEPLAPDAETGETLSPLAAFLTHAALESGDNQAQAGQDAVQLMTVHAAKGLEFDCVFITGMEEGLFPHENSMSDFESLEEERRLMYVAITRARKRLYLSHSQTRMLHGQTRYNVKSRFFDELPESALKWLTPRNQGFAPSAFGYGGGYGSTRGGSGGYGGGYGGSSGGSRDKDTFASPPVPPQKTAPSHGLRSGMQVFHNKFGEGTVTALEGSGDDARAQVKFARHGVKWLALSVAKLTPI